MQLTRLAWLGGLLGLAQGYVYGSSGLYTGTDPGTSASPTSAPYGNSTSYYYYPTDPTGTAVDPTGGPTDPPYSTGTVASTGDPSGSGKLTYTAPTGVPAEYFYHHKKPKRNGPYRGWGYQA